MRHSLPTGAGFKNMDDRIHGQVRRNGLLPCTWEPAIQQRYAVMAKVFGECPFRRYNIPMWIPTAFKLTPVTIQSENEPAFVGTELWADDVQICCAVERVNWDEDPVHLRGCTDCLTGDCVDGAWLSIRRAGSYMLFLPSFWWWLEDNLYDKGYDDPPAFLQKGAMLLDRALYADLRSLVPMLPAMAKLQPLAGWEAVRLLRFEAPVEVLGKASEPVKFHPGLVLHSDWWGPDYQAVKVLEELLESWVDSYEPVALKRLPMYNVPVSFYLSSGPRSVEWQPLSSGLRDLLRLEPGYVVDKMPELPTEIPVSNLMVTTHLRKGRSLQTEIRVDNHLLYDFTSRWLQVDLFELAQSLDQEGEYFIITCWCGNAGCAGIHRGIDIYYNGGRVFWVIYEPAPARTLVFDEQAYRQAVQTALAEFRQLGAQHPMSLVDRLMLDRVAGLNRPSGEPR